MTDIARFEAFATSSARMLNRTAWLLTGDRHHAEDLVQEALARVFLRWRDDECISNPEGYARTVLVRLHLKRRRRRASYEIVSDTAGDQADQAAMPAQQDMAATIALRQALADLEIRDQTVLVLRYFADLPVSEVAGALGISDAAVRTRASRARSRLRDRLGADFLVASH